MKISLDGGVGVGDADGGCDGVCANANVEKLRIGTAKQINFAAQILMRMRLAYPAQNYEAA